MAKRPRQQNRQQSPSGQQSPPQPEVAAPAEAEQQAESVSDQAVEAAGEQVQVLEVKAEALIDAKVEAKAEPEVEAKVEPVVEVKAEPEVGVKAEALTDARAEPMVEAKLELQQFNPAQQLPAPPAPAQPLSLALRLTVPASQVQQPAAPWAGYVAAQLATVEKALEESRRLEIQSTAQILYLLEQTGRQARLGLAVAERTTAGWRSLALASTQRIAELITLKA